MLYIALFNYDKNYLAFQDSQKMIQAPQDFMKFSSKTSKIIFYLNDLSIYLRLA